ncbi:hypothetical protein [Rubritalea tangerina]|uniref:DUF3352 domain-containing protein n=1 Tax=Rubritalea tangerina TaxID=430798 RepID=A0ABW4ZDJ7_9BACT
MKQRTYFILPIVAASSLMLTSCDKGSKEVVKETLPEGAAEVQKPAGTEAEAPAPQVDRIDALAKAAGFAQYLPKGADAFWAFYDGAGIAKQLRGSALGQGIEEMMEAEGGSLEDFLSDPSFQQFADVAGEEVFMAMGDDTAEQTENLLKASMASNFHQFRSLVEIFGMTLSGSDEVIDEEEYLKDWAKDPKTLKVFEASKMPPMYLGFKVSDADKRTEYVAQLQGLASMALEGQGEDEKVLEPIDQDGFMGFTVKGDLLVKMIEKEGADEAIEVLGEETFQQYMDKAKSKDFVMMAGAHEDYVVLFFGSSVDQMVFSKTPQESFLADKGMQFAQKYADQKLVSALYVSESVYEVLVRYQASFKDMAEGVIAGLQESDAYGDTAVLEALLKDLIVKEKNYYAPFRGGRFGSVAFLDQGLKFETYYGGNAPQADLKSKRQLSKVGKGDGVLFSANWVNNSAQAELGLQYLDSVGSVTYQLAKQASGLKLEDPDFEEFMTGFDMFDNMFKADLLKVWGALRGDMVQGLGSESAIVMDIGGELPTMPMIPEEALKEAKLPRLSYLSTVEDRSKLAASWETLNATAEKSLKQVSEMFGENIPMQRPFKSESNGLTSWTFQIPFTHQNCIPNVSLSDELFILGTSSDFSVELAKAFEKEASGAPMAEMQFNFSPLTELGENWLSQLEKHSEEFMSESEQSDFEEAIPVMKKLLEASKGMDYIRSVSVQEGAEIHNTFHIKTQ